VTKNASAGKLIQALNLGPYKKDRIFHIYPLRAGKGTLHCNFPESLKLEIIF
jgi:hypothetical protein